jgi:hypothetical protein
MDTNSVKNMRSRLNALVPKYAKGGAVGKIKRLIAQHHSAIEMEDADTATRVGRMLDAEKPGLSRESLKMLNEGKNSEDYGRNVKLATFNKGGGVRRILHRKDGSVVNRGDKIKSLRGVEYELVDYQDKPAPSSGRVYVKRPGTDVLRGHEESYYPSVFDLELREAEAPKLVKKAKGGAIKSVADRLEQLRQRVKTMPAGPERDAVVDEYSGARRDLGQRTTDPRKKFNKGGGAKAAVKGLTALISKFEGKSMMDFKRMSDDELKTAITQTETHPEFPYGELGPDGVPKTATPMGRQLLNRYQELIGEAEARGWVPIDDQ